MRILIGAALVVAVIGSSISGASARTLEEKRAILACRDRSTEMSIAAEHVMSTVMNLDEQFQSTGGLTHHQAIIVYDKVQNYIDQANFKMRNLTN